jgi:hypothetical protein
MVADGGVHVLIRKISTTNKKATQHRLVAQQEAGHDSGWPYAYLRVGRGS